MDLSPEPLSPDPRWRAISEPTFLMCPPELYDVSYVINPWMEGNVHRSCRRQAMEQWQQLHCALAEIAQVELVEPQPGSPDMVFTANAGLVHRGVVALSSFRHPERQGEEPHFRKWFDDSGFGVCDLPRATPFEGEGDALFADDGSCLWAGHGIRTLQSSHRHLSDTWKVDVVSLRLIDARFYHLDTCLCPLFGGYVMYFPAAFDAASQSRIEARYPEEKRIVVGEADALRFACNAINVGRTILLNQISGELRGRLESLGFLMIEVPLSEFLKAGGAAKCLALRLSEMDVTHNAARAEQPGSAVGEAASPESALQRTGIVRYNTRYYEENRVRVAAGAAHGGPFLGG
ncbi:MAG TPA: amidinotransferase [Terriglobales bacterium]|nr:amidinotransferase [Terriglobales bacterium]